MTAIQGAERGAGAVAGGRSERGREYYGSISFLRRDARQPGGAAAPRLFGRQMGEKLEPLIHGHDVNGETVPHKPLKCCVMTRAETAVIELDEASCELQRQYHPCRSVCACAQVGGGGRSELDKGATNWNAESPVCSSNGAPASVFYSPVK